METLSPLLLAVWRETCRHIELGEAMERIAPLLAPAIPAQAMLVRHVAVDRSVMETLAAVELAGTEQAAMPRSEMAPEVLDGMLAWWHLRRVRHAAADVIIRELPALLPPETSGDVIAVPLACEHGLFAVMILVSRKGVVFTEGHQQLALALAEPLAVAVENDRRLKELVALREKVEAENRRLLSKLGRSDLSETIVGSESGLREVMERATLVARADVPVLLLGETGSGKEVIARAVHRGSRRAEGPFLRVNCGAIPAELVDSELFGHEKGSFTGASAIRKGWFERADGGTLFLDECGELTPAAQVRLLRVLQDGTFERVGGEKQLHVDVRVIAATHRNLQGMVREGTFREDLWYRLAVFPVHLPPLRDRREDIPAMAIHFAARAAARYGLRPCNPTEEDMHLLLNYSWPGNARELGAVMERAAILGNGHSLDVATALGNVPALPAATSPPAQRAPAAVASSSASRETVVTLDEANRRHIQSALAATDGQIEGHRGAAKILGINPHTLRARMRKLGIAWQTFRPSGDGPSSATS
ncbi:sigma54 specific transcriptional regulator, Fis family [Pirellula staleyi DSM 6068]|uniref:Sigma54 specific transcriptional regulator, Fis family n=1 Tax=Pirellula staleyi (strain ATCC 27377 / DSM 6068 / ICPB 4128) TaxID=530564 RepID=D2R4F1_PIRSD|nr:sigma54 specific transcriptional regulator, Fis family [Pirellula staleyi DSM 6068]